MRKIALTVAALALLAAPAQHAAAWDGKTVDVGGYTVGTPGVTEVFLAYGTGATVCHVTVTKRTGQELYSPSYGTKYSGRTQCTAPVVQTAQATVGSLTGALCSNTSTYCSSGGNAENVINTQPLRYRITLRAPGGQGWVGDPTFCSGIGTDNLTCEYLINDVVAGMDVVEGIDSDEVPLPDPGPINLGEPSELICDPTCTPRT